MAAQLKNSSIVVNGHHPVHGGASLIVWLLGQGASVTVAGMRDDEASSYLRRRVDEQLKRNATDGRAYTSTVARLSWTRRASAHAANAYELVTSAWRRKLVVVTGRVGKSTTALWAAHLIGDAVVAGHSPDKPLVSVLNSRARIAVIEADESYATPAPRSSVCSTDAAHQDALVDADVFGAVWGGHNVRNAAAAVAIARSAGVPVATIAKRLTTLPQLPYRQEVVSRDAKLTVVNDALAMNPEAGIAAVRRWGGPTTILVTGGDGESEYRTWTDEVSALIRGTNIVVLSGSATRAMRTAFRRKGFVVPGCDTVERAVAAALDRANTYVSATLLLSPAASHADHYDIARRFNAAVGERGRH